MGVGVAIEGLGGLEGLGRLGGLVRCATCKNSESYAKFQNRTAYRKNPGVAKTHLWRISASKKTSTQGKKTSGRVNTEDRQN